MDIVQEMCVGQLLLSIRMLLDHLVNQIYV